MKTLPNSHLPIIRTLLDEHVVIQTALTVLKELTVRVSGRQVVKAADLRTIAKFFRDYADKIHHQSEEEILFATVLRSRSLGSMTQKLLTQHMIGRIFQGEMSRAVHSAERSGRGWRQSFVGSATAYITLLTIHICDEDHVYFPRSERLLRRTGNKLSWRAKNPKEKLRLERSIRRLAAKYRPVSVCNNCGDTATCTAVDHSNRRKQHRT